MRRFFLSVLLICGVTHGYATPLTQTWMKRIIFVSHAYLPQARQKVQAYKDRVIQQMISQNWAHLHDLYYALQEKEDFEIFQKQKDYTECMQKMAVLTLGKDVKLQPLIR